MAQYHQQKLYRDTIFIVLGDHGEAFGEHGRRKHDDVLYEEVTRVPLLVHDPLNPSGRRIEETASLLDIVPTVVDLLGFDIVDGSYPGYSLRDLPEHRTLHFRCFNDGRCVGQLNGEHKYIHYFGLQPDELFDLSRDPLEKHNLLLEDSESAQALRESVLTWQRNLDERFRFHHRRRIAPFLFEARPPVQHENWAVFEDNLALIGYDLSRTRVRPGEAFEVTYYFEVRHRIPRSWRLVVELEGDGASLDTGHHP